MSSEVEVFSWKLELWLLKLERELDAEQNRAKRHAKRYSVENGYIAYIVPENFRMNIKEDKFHKYNTESLSS